MILRLWLFILISCLATSPGFSSITSSGPAQYDLRNSNRVDNFAGDLADSAPSGETYTLVLPENGRVSYELRRFMERLNRHGLVFNVVRVSTEKYNGMLSQQLDSGFDLSDTSRLEFPGAGLIEAGDLKDMIFGVQQGGIFWDYILEKPTEPFPERWERLPEGPLKRFYRLKHRLSGYRKMSFDRKITTANLLKNIIFLSTFLPIALTQKSITDITLWKPVVARSILIWFFGYHSREMQDIFSQRVAASVQPVEKSQIDRAGVQTDLARIRMNQGFLYSCSFLLSFTISTALLWLFQANTFGLASVASSATATLFSTFAFMPFGKLGIVFHRKSRESYRELSTAEIPAINLPDSPAFHRFAEDFVNNFSLPKKKVFVRKELIETNGKREIQLRIEFDKRTQEDDKAVVFKEFHDEGKSLHKAYERNLYIQQYMGLALRVIAPIITNAFLFLDSSSVLFGLPVGLFKEKPLEILGSVGIIYDIFIFRFSGLHNMTGEVWNFIQTKKVELQKQIAKKLGLEIDEAKLEVWDSKRPSEVLLLRHNNEEL